MRRLLLVLVIIAAFITPFSRPAPASAAGQILEWESGPGFATFGANASVFIALGTVEFQCDFIFPTANIYVVQGNPGDGAALVDVSGSPNTVVGATGGVFADTIAITQPSGTLGEGVYTVVYDECQDGSFDDGIDAVFPDAFEVVLPSTLPPIDPAIGALKASAGDLADKMKAVLTILDLYEAYQEIQEAIECMTSPGECVIAMIADELTGAILDQIRLMLGLSVDPKLAARDAALDTISHWEGIEADPPDPAFEQHTLIERPAAIDPESGDPLVEAEVALGNAHLTEGALAAALLHAIERYQGAQLADDGDWTLVHARETHNFATLMAEQLLDSNLALTNLVNALNTDTRDIDQVSATLSADRQRIVASGFLPDEVQVLRNLGLDQAGMAALRARIAEQGAGSVSESVLIAALNGLIAANSSAITDMQVLATAMDAAIAAILLDPATDDNFPVADAGGSYTAAEGTSLALDGSGSSALIGSLATHAWDLDGDGAFDDALGATPSVSFDDPLDGFIGLKVTDDRGLTGVSYAAINIVSTNSPPVISSVSPDAFHPEIIVGTSQTFSVTATDPDGDGISVAWLLDGESAGSGSSFVYTPLEADGLGGHWLRASVSAGGDTRVYDWTPLVLLPDADSDGWRANIDCDDTDAAVNPSATEILGNGKDDDCDTATPDDGDGPLAFFNPVMSGGGSNVARYEDGARAVLFSQTTPLAAQLPNVMLDDYLGTPQQQWTTSAPNPFTIVDLAGDEPVVIDRVSVRGATNASFSVRTFDIAVSTTTTDDSAFTTVVSGTVLPPTTTHQFILPAPVLAKYIRYKPVGSSGVTMTTRLQAWTGQVGSGTTVTFGNLSTDANGDIVSYAWDFGDGSPTSNAESPTHTFPGAGSYTVTLTVTDAIGNTGVFSVVQQIVPPPSQPDILLFGPTLVAGATSPEYFEARRLGLTPRIIDTNEWQAMTAAEFASYKAIVLGDNFGTQAGPINQAATNSANWKPAVTGNIIVLGGDLAAHAAKGGGEMINRSIQFAMAQPGKTGIVILLGGYFFQAGANTVVPVLEVLRPGEFRVQGAGCYDPAHFTASHPAFSGLTDANLTGWACSVHETFNVIPSDFVVITAALGIGTYVNTDGSIGQPHIVASGTNITPITRITLAPASATNDPGQPQSMTATVKNGTIATPNTTVTFTVTSGPHTGVTGTAITNASGVAIFSYTGSQSGVDEIVASFVDGTAVTHSSNVASVTWSQPSVSVNAGDDQTVVEGDIVSLVSTFSNSDSIASHSATIDWGDGTIEDGIVSESAGAGSVTGSHQYLDNGTYSVALCVTDTSAITSCDTLIVTVSNAAPVVTALTVPAQLAGTAATLDLASFFDEGTLDSHTATIDWGDGTIEPATIGHEAGLTGPIAHHAGEHSSDAFGNVSGTHAYSTAGDYTVTITVTDDDGDSGTATFTLSVTTANGVPVLSAIGEQTLDEGATLAISVLALDPDGDPLTLTPAGLPAFATFTTNGSGSA
ncbi:MAG TPA: PKD domain-containing protein, partial [Thermomicrobiales bacterium]|nr:PKD domain-containing protein [Thermomicrobiales bacterium]